MAIAEKEHKKKTKANVKQNNKVIPIWFNKTIETSTGQDDDNEEFKKFIEEFRK